MHFKRTNDFPSSLRRAIFTAYRGLFSPLIHAFSGGQGVSGCRFEPTCGDYANDAIQMHGWARGSLLTVLRICRCHPWGGAGLDPVPQKKG